MKQHLISVAMAVYNGEKFLRQQLESLCSQTVAADEIVITDDCSSDRTVAIILEFKKRLPICLEINRYRVGFVKNFERAISLCKGQFIALCDQDDIWNPVKIERLITKIGECGVIHSDAQVICERGSIIAESWTSYFRKKKEHNFKEYLCGRNNITGCTSLINRKILDSLLPIPDEMPFHDWWIGMIAAKNGGVKYLHEQLMQYRLHQSNAIGNKKMYPESCNPYLYRYHYFCALIRERQRLQLDRGEIFFLEDVKRFYYNKSRKPISLENMLLLARHHKYIGPQNTLLLPLALLRAITRK